MNRNWRGGRVVEGAPLLRVRAFTKDIKAHLRTTFSTLKMYVTSAQEAVVPPERPTTPHFEDIYDTLIAVLDCRVQKNRDALDAWAIDELAELRETLVSMQKSRTDCAEFHQK